MYEKFYGLREKPFSLVPDPDYLFLGRLHRAALNMLEYGLRGQASFTLITGEVGCGKTILIRRFLRIVDDSSTVGMITNTPRSRGHILERILLAFKLDYRGKSEVEQYETIINFLEEQQSQGQRTVLIIDEAHNLDEDSLEELRMLSNFNVDKTLALQIILVGQPEILDLLNTVSLRQLTQRISVNFRLLPLGFPETRLYIRHRLRVAGGSPDIFETRAIAVVHLLSGGIPRLINILCDAALVYGFGEGRETLDADLIQVVAADMLLGGLATLPTVDRNFEKEKLLKTADKLVASLDPDELDEEYVELPPPLSASHIDSPTPASEDNMSGEPGQEKRDEGELKPNAGESRGAPEIVIPIVDTSPIKKDGAGGSGMIVVLAVLATAAVLGSGLLWFYWPSIERIWASWSDSPSAVANTDVAMPASPPPIGKTPEERKVSPTIPEPTRIPAGEAVESGSNPPDASIEMAAPRSSNDAAAVLPADPIVEQPGMERPLELDAGKQAVPDNAKTDSNAAPIPTTLADVLDSSDNRINHFGATLAGLFKLWNQDFSALAGASPCNKASNAGLSCYEHEGNLDKLIHFNRPAIIGLQRADRGIVYALLTRRDEASVRLQIGEYEISASPEEVNSLMSGPFLLLWKPPAGFSGLLVEGQRGKTVEWLRTELGKVLPDNVSVGSGERFDPELTWAVREFQQRNALKVDGIVGVETLIRINSASLGNEVPTLD